MHDANADARQHHALIIKTAHQHVDALALFTKYIVEGDLDILEDQLTGV